eukprot:XP_001696493.1 predicted protein [Chlamydomonas reinhardtii]
MHQPLLWEEDWEKVTPRETVKPGAQGSSLYVGLPPLAVRLAADAAKAAAAQSASAGIQSTSTDITMSSGRKRPNASTAKSLRPQQVMMIELQKKLDVLMKEYSVVETENSRLRARLRVIEAVLPVRQKLQKQPSQPLPSSTPTPTPTGTGMVYDARPNEMYIKRRQVNMETGVEEVPPDSFWTLVASGMRLTPAQVADCRTALTLYRERMERPVHLHAVRAGQGWGACTPPTTAVTPPGRR